MFWNAAAITGAVLVGVFTHDAGFIALTFFGGLIVPRMLGLVPRRRRLRFAAPAVLLGVVAVIIAVQVMRHLREPATSLVAAAQGIEAGDYSARVPVRGPRQLRSLARAFNEMSSRLESEEARRQTVIADVAHELRTPLTVIRGQTEAIMDGIYTCAPERLTPILAATDTLEALIDDLRTLAPGATFEVTLPAAVADAG